MKKEDLLQSDFFKQFKTTEEFHDFFKNLHNRGIEAMLEGELDNHLGYDKHSKAKTSNARNGYGSKTIKTSLGESEIQVPRDRDGSFNPIIVPKRKNMIDGIENVVISLYAKGMSNRDIEEQIREIYGFEISASTISRITDKVSEDIIAWQNRPLESVYFIVWMDGIVFKVRENSRIINKTIYIAVGLRKDGKKEVLGLWLGKNESAAFWMSVLTDIKARGVTDILITATDNLNGFTDTITSVFPESRTQICVIHQIRNACRYVVWKDKKEFTVDMKKIYTAPTKQAAEAALNDFAVKWQDKYGYAVKSWQSNWEELTVFFDFPIEIRRIIYTTNLIENLNGKIRKYTKNKLSFPTNEAVIKSVYLAVRETAKKWNKPIPNWGLIINQFMTIFAERAQL